MNQAELSHVYANQTKTQGQAHALSFECESAFSYSKRIALITNRTIKRDGVKKRIVVASRRSYSITTSKHQSAIARAFRGHDSFFILYDSENWIASGEVEAIKNAVVSSITYCVESLRRLALSNGQLTVWRKIDGHYRRVKTGEKERKESLEERYESAKEELRGALNLAKELKQGRAIKPYHRKLLNYSRAELRKELFAERAEKLKKEKRDKERQRKDYFKNATEKGFSVAPDMTLAEMREIVHRENKERERQTRIKALRDFGFEISDSVSDSELDDKEEKMQDEKKRRSRIAELRAVGVEIDENADCATVFEAYYKSENYEKIGNRKLVNEISEKLGLSLHYDMPRAEIVKQAQEANRAAFLAGKEIVNYACQVYVGLEGHDLLRRKNQTELETSRGAVVKLWEAQILAKRYLAKEKILGETIGGFPIVGINGELKIGCHTFDLAQVLEVLAVEK